MYSELNPGCERYAELGALEEKHLLEFARQIGAGMVCLVEWEWRYMILY